MISGYGEERKVALECEFWIAVGLVVLSGRINAFELALTESDLHPKVREMPITFYRRCATCVCEVTLVGGAMLLILLNLGDLINRGQISDVTDKINSHVFEWLQSVTETFSITFYLGWFEMERGIEK